MRRTIQIRLDALNSEQHKDFCEVIRYENSEIEIVEWKDDGGVIFTYEVDSSGGNSVARHIFDQVILMSFMLNKLLFISIE